MSHEIKFPVMPETVQFVGFDFERSPKVWAKSTYCIEVSLFLVNNYFVIEDLREKMCGSFSKVQISLIIFSNPGITPFG